MTIYQSKEMHRRYTFHRLWSIYVQSLPHQRKKRYGALFISFSCRVIHIEVTNVLDTNSFILALRRLMAKRGVVAWIQENESRTSCMD